MSFIPQEVRNGPPPRKSIKVPIKTSYKGKPDPEKVRRGQRKTSNQEKAEMDFSTKRARYRFLPLKKQVRDGFLFIEDQIWVLNPIAFSIERQGWTSTLERLELDFCQKKAIDGILSKKGPE